MTDGKGRAEIGETRERSGGTFKKVAEGKWVRWAEGKKDDGSSAPKGSAKGAEKSKKKDPSFADLHQAANAASANAKKLGTREAHEAAVNAHHAAATAAHALGGSIEGKLLAAHHEGEVRAHGNKVMDHLAREEEVRDRAVARDRKGTEEHPLVVGKAEGETHGKGRDALSMKFGGQTYFSSSQTGTSNHDGTPVRAFETEKGHRVWVDDKSRVHADSKDEVPALKEAAAKGSKAEAKPKADSVNREAVRAHLAAKDKADKALQSRMGYGPGKKYHSFADHQADKARKASQAEQARRQRNTSNILAGKKPEW